ncbi:cytochrome c [Rhizobium rhizogenes]|uniref:c-type cytochrome n=1 Tax=Rhizobium rhizogenes TaxID=359 RepID=UPI0022721964|nr:cytochrome c [Rhizobium rhizogenes]
MSASSAALAAGDDAQAATIKRGAYVAIASDCVACHTAPGGKPFAGGLAIASPVGTIYSTNITPSATAGIGQYTEEQFSRAVRRGVRADGANLYPAMPYTSYNVLTDADIHDLYTYLQHGIDPVDTVPKPTALPFPMNIRLSMMAWNLLFLGSGNSEADATQSAEWNRGKYLADGAAHCSTCHTPRGFLMQELSSHYLGGGQVGPWYAPNITSDAISGIGSWSKDELARYLATGSLPGKAQAAGSMGEAIEHSFSHLTPDDISAIATYIKTVAPLHDASDNQSRFGYGQPFTQLASLRGANPIRSDTDEQASGAVLFYGNCASCHQPSGQGSKDDYYPSLFHNSATGGTNRTNLISTILNGVSRTTPKGQAFMPGFGGKANDINALNDNQVATLANYVIEHYGRPGTPVTPANVAEVRAGGPASSLLLLARIGIAVAVVVGLAIIALLIVCRQRRARTA